MFRRSIAVAIISTASAIGIASMASATSPILTNLNSNQNIRSKTTKFLNTPGKLIAIPNCEVPNPPPICDPRPSPIPPNPEPGGEDFRLSANLIQQIVTLINNAASGTQIHLNNYGSRHGNSWHKANDSYIRLSRAFGGNLYQFNIPEFVKDIDCGIFCPDLGDAKFYVQDMNLNRIQLAWQSPNFKLSLFFESNGREIKGFHTGSLKSLGDNGMPDANINNARLDVYLRPIALNGRASYRVVKSDFHADIQATGACDVLGVDACDWLFDYKDKIASQIETQVRKRLNDNQLRDRIADQVQTVLEKVGLGSVNITRISVDGNDLIIRYTNN